MAVFLSTVVTAFVVWSSHDQSRRSAIRSLETSAYLLEKSVTSALEVVNISLQRIYADALSISNLSPENQHTRLQEIIVRNLRASPYIGRITIIDAKNIILADSASPKNTGQILAITDYKLHAHASVKNELLIGHVQKSRSPLWREGIPPQHLKTNEVPIIPILLLKKPASVPKWRIIAEIKASWFLDLLRTVHIRYVDNAAILCTDDVTSADSIILSTSQDPLRSLAPSKKLSSQSQKRISIHKTSERYPFSIQLMTTNRALDTSWLRNNHSFLLVACLIPFGLGIVFTFLLLDSKNRTLLNKKDTLWSHALEQAPFAFMITDASGHIIYINKRFSTLFGYSLGETKGKNPRFLKSNLLNEKTYKHLWETLVAGHEWEGGLINKTKDGDLKWVNTKITPLCNPVGPVTHYICVHIEDTFHKVNHDETTQALTRLNQDRQASESFLTSLSYDLTASLKSTANALSFFRSHHVPDLSPAATLHFTDILNGIRRAQALTDDLVTCYQDPHTATETAPVDVNDILHKIERKLSKEQPTKILRITHSPLPKIFACQHEIVKVFEYLIRNAAQVYSPLFSCNISVSAHQENLFWRFRIASSVNGATLHLQREATLFHKASFATVNNLPSEVTELNVCKKIIGTYGGTIWVEREIGELEYRIFFTFPRNAVQKNKDNSQDRKAPGSCCSDMNITMSSNSCPSETARPQKQVS